ncbi:MAG: hypothetical protein GWN62_14775, partial [Aliifodinibius sp.]|nr:hypothetical protein [Fodinibius sp.]
MPTNVTFILAELNDDNQNGLPPITSEIQIIGNGSSINRSITAPPFRFFLIEPEGHLMLENLTVNGGLANLGGAFYNKGVIEINGGGVIDNHALYRGGAIFNYVDSVAIINDVVFDSNSSEQHAGGAIYSWS